MTNKTFNVTGVCIPEKHYMVDTGQRIKTITDTLIVQGKYFTINRARQYGKTTTLYLLERYLQNKYTVISLSFEAADDLFASRYLFAMGFVRRVGKKLKQTGIDESIIDKWNVPISDTFPMDDLSDRITTLCTECGKKVVLMIDEVDKSSDNQIFLSFLGMLRTKYLEQQQGLDFTFHSVILAGVYDIKNLKLKLHPDEESKYNSPWNIAADFDMNMGFSAQEIGSMLKEYENDYHTGMNVENIAREIYDYTSGYPYMVSRICKRIAEELDGKGGFAVQGSAWSENGVVDAVKMILNESNTLFDDMRKKIADYPDLKKMLYAILFHGQSFAYNPDNFLIDMGCMFGFIKEENGKVVIANRIFEMRLYNLFLSEEMLNNQMYTEGSKLRNQFIHDGILDMELVLQKFMEYFSEIYSHSGDKFIEENGRRLFLLYLKPIINGTGNYYIESRTRNMGRTDIIVDYLGKQYIIEMKIWHGNEYNERGEKQLVSYLEDYHQKTGYMVSFNFNKNKKVGMKKLNVGNKKLIEIVV